MQIIYTDLYDFKYSNLILIISKIAQSAWAVEYTDWGLPFRFLWETPEPVLDLGPERGSANLGPFIRHLVSTRLPSGGRAALLSPLSPMYSTRPSV